ncbi:MAG TPA: hypothetical protein VIA18_13130 [Polyangia bacterium]|jgi:hypothetical protein|nr:hypothetical protein [Polyangia bacterium]
MKLTGTLTVGLLVASLNVYSVAYAQHEHEGGGHPAGGHEGGHEGGHQVNRPAPPKFVAHPPGAHPRGPAGHGHAVRVLAPRVVVRGGHREWKHWSHPEFARPAYYWDWATIHNVSCTAEDSYGDQYPVTQAAYAGFGQDGMTSVEDDALDRCYSESGGDQSCYLATCSHF